MELSMKSRRPHVGTMFAPVAEKARCWRDRVRRWRAERRTYAELAKLSDRMIEDLGFRRVRLGPDYAVIVPVLDEAALRRTPVTANDNATARLKVDPSSLAQTSIPTADAERRAGAPRLAA